MTPRVGLALALSFASLPAHAQTSSGEAPQAKPPTDTKDAAPEEPAPSERSAEEGQSSEESQAPNETTPSEAEEAPEKPPIEEAEVSPPAILTETPVQYPDGEDASGRVLLVVTVSADGRATDITVDEGLTDALNQAALDALKNWTFTPAKRGGKPIAARIRVALELTPPGQAVEPEAAAPAEAEPKDASEKAKPGHVPSADHVHPDDVHMRVTVHGERPLRTSRRSSSDYFIHREILEAAPQTEGAEALRAAPGLTLFRTEGLAQAHSYSLRGFDAEHGQDIEFEVGGLPINLPSHIHGQGYADLSFLVGEVVDEVAVSEGVSDPAQGDFAVAGSVRVGLGVDEDRRGLQVRGGYGSFGTPRVQVIWAPKEAERESLGAAQYTATDGFGENRAGKSASGLVQHRFGKGPVTYRTVGLIHGARGDSAGVVRQEDIDSGEVCYHCVYDQPTAKAQNGLSQRLMAGFFADYRGPEHANGTIGFFVGRDHFRSQQNFTGYLESSQYLPGESGRGDLIEQTNGTTTLGLTGRYRTEAFHTESWGHGTVEVGVDGRFDGIGQTQNLLDASVRNQTWDRRVDAQINALDTGIWGDVDWQFGDHIQARAGMRGAILSYDVNDRLGNFAPLSRPQDQFLPGYRRSSIGATFGPRASVQVTTVDWLIFTASYGEGYRSPQARTLEDGENAPFAKVRSADTGVRFRLGNPLDLTLSGYYTHLSDDVAFDASEGRLEGIGPTRRMGAVAYAVLRPMDWLLASLSATYVNTALLEPPPATADEPNPPFEKGQPLPYVSPLVLRLDSSARHALATFKDGKTLDGKIGLGLTYIAPRPLPYNQTGRPIPLLDASAGLYWGPFDLTVSGFNLLNLDYAAQEYVFVSDWDPNSPTSRTPARHIAAGAPLSVMALLGVTL